ncbi:MAG: MmgE/PrpD family protein [Rhizomicrobium sp.]
MANSVGTAMRHSEDDDRRIEADSRSLSRILAGKVNRLSFEALAPEVVDKVRIALLDFLSCALEAKDLPWSRQAIRLAASRAGTVPVIGTAFRTSPSEAAFANAVLGHGLVREDMHTASVSHLGVVVLPTLLALSQRVGMTGRDFIVAAVAGYEAGAALGRAIVDGDLVRRFRPTGITGPIAGAVAGCRLLRLDPDRTVNAIGLAANTTGGFNEWAIAGGEEMFFHPGFAARNAVTAVELAKFGARASETALDGPSGLFAGYGRGARAAAMKPFSGPAFEIMSVYHKPAPACNYAQTACQAALALAERPDFDSAALREIVIAAPQAAVAYPGCNFAGPFDGPLRAKMSIPFSVAATLAHRRLAEENYRDLRQRDVLRLVALTRLVEDTAFTAAYPAMQGAQVALRFADGGTAVRRLDDLVPARPDEIRARFRSAGGRVLGIAATSAVEHFVGDLERHDALADLGNLLSTAKRSTAYHG